jgi:Spy/CpxP family protein refolding chaperone
MLQRTLITLVLGMLLSVPAWSQPAGNSTRSGGYGMMGPGMMGGGGYGMMGPGMMGGYGYGMGPGMMGGYGPGNWGPNIPDLTKEQRSKISAIQKEFRNKQWALMERMQEDSELGSFYRGGKFDEQAARKAYETPASVHKQMFENFIEMQKSIDGVLTQKQRDELQRTWGGR